MADNVDTDYATFTEVPWFRRASVNMVAALLGLIVPPFLWLVAVVLFTGAVYSPRKDESGKLKTWGDASKWIVLVIVALQLFRWLRGQGFLI